MCRHTNVWHQVGHISCTGCDWKHQGKPTLPYTDGFAMASRKLVLFFSRYRNSACSRIIGFVEFYQPASEVCGMPILLCQNVNFATEFTGSKQSKYNLFWFFGLDQDDASTSSTSFLLFQRVSRWKKVSLELFALMLTLRLIDLVSLWFERSGVYENIVRMIRDGHHASFIFESVC